MKTDPLKLYEEASEWTLEKVVGAKDKLDAGTPCDKWNVQALMNHMLETSQYFVNSAKGQKDASPPSANPPEILSDDPVADFKKARAETLKTFGADGVIEKTGPSIGIAFSDTLLHGWDLARATGQDTTMPKGLAEAAYKNIHGKFTDEQRKGIFAPELKVPADASAEDKLLAYTGRIPAA
jgi:uncharacterized protein (TIGR03086 family)